MHASLAFVNGAGNKRRSSGSPSEREKLRLLDTLLSTAKAAKPASKRGGFKNDPNDPTNPNELRERRLKKIKR